jgi:hypothetical protein
MEKLRQPADKPAKRKTAAIKMNLSPTQSVFSKKNGRLKRGVVSQKYLALPVLFRSVHAIPIACKQKKRVTFHALRIFQF